jgi:hypothetical protein
VICPQQQRRRDREAEGFSGLEVENEIELGWLLDRKIDRLGALQNLLNIARGASERTA